MRRVQEAPVVFNGSNHKIPISSSNLVKLDCTGNGNGAGSGDRGDDIDFHGSNAKEDKDSVAK